MKKKVLILGSCVSRDVLNFDKENSLELVEYYARSSLISLYGGGEPLEELEFLEQLQSSFQKKIVTFDLKKTFVHKINLIAFDVLLMDFIDERFDIFVLQDGSKYTLSSELLSTNFLQKHQGRRILFGTDEHYDLWEKAWKAFVHHLKSLNILDKLIIQKSFWSFCDEEDTNYNSVNYCDTKINHANSYLQRLYRCAIEDLLPKQMIDTSKNTIGASKHRWGRSPFHYKEQYYIDVLSYIKEYDIQKINKYNPASWHVDLHVYKDIESFISNQSLENGIHRIRYRDNKFLDIYIKNLELLIDSHVKYMLVGFNGAVVSREKLTAPFFSGISIADDLNVPVISISDPTLNDSEQLGIGWYAGNDDILNLPYEISRILKNISVSLNLKLILIGGSAGGYASLVQSMLLDIEHMILVWNPQTEIEKYVCSFVEQYKKHAFKDYDGDIKYNPSDIFINKIEYKKIQQRSKIIYLQNESDWHLNEHLAPLIKEVELTRYGKSTFVDNSGNMAVYIGDWGNGHTAVPRGIILELLQTLIKTHNHILAVWNLDAYTRKNIININAVNFKINFLVSYTVVDNLLTVTCNIDEDINHTLKFAFYLLVNNEKKEVRWYEETKELKVNIQQYDINDTLEVVCFVKDIFGNIKIKNINIKS